MRVAINLRDEDLSFRLHSTRFGGIRTTAHASSLMDSSYKAYVIMPSLQLVPKQRRSFQTGARAASSFE